MAPPELRWQRLQRLSHRGQLSHRRLGSCPGIPQAFPYSCAKSEGPAPLQTVQLTRRWLCPGVAAAHAGSADAVVPALGRHAAQHILPSPGMCQWEMPVFFAAAVPRAAVRECCLLCRAASDAAHMAEADAKAVLAAESAADEAAAAQAVQEGKAVSRADAAAAAASVAEPPSAPPARSTVLREVAAAQQNDVERAQVRPLVWSWLQALPASAAADGSQQHKTCAALPPQC